MTIGIGVLASGDEGRRKGVIPDHLILVSDTMGSFGDEYSHPRLHKRFDLPEQKTYIVAADSIDRAAELVGIIEIELSVVPIEQRNYGGILRAVCTACFKYKIQRFTLQVLPKHRLPPEMVDPSKVPQELRDTLAIEWEELSINADLIVGAFDFNGQAHLIVVDGSKGRAEGVSLPGFTAIGSGFPNAMYWLAHRQHTLGMKPLRALYHAYEAKIMAADAPNVNEHIDIMVANAEGSWSCTSHSPLSEIAKLPEFPLDSLTELFAKHGPQSTEELDRRKIELIKDPRARA